MPDLIAHPEAERSIEHLVRDEPCDVAYLAGVLVRTFPEQGLDRMTPAKVESCLCTSALTASL